MTRPGLRVGTVVLVGLVVACGAYLALAWWSGRYGTTPPVTWIVAVLLLLLAGFLVVSGRRVRATRRGTTSRPLHPIGAFRTLTLAQASALTGAIAAGYYLAYALVGLPDVDAASVRERTIVAATVALSGMLLSVAGMWVQSVCRIDPPEVPPADESDTAEGA